MNRKYFSKILLLALGMGVSLHTAARQNSGESSGVGKPNKDGNKISANCLAGSSSSSLDINNVRATVLNGGDMWWDLFDARYEVPKVTDPNAPRRHSLFAGSVWIGGKDPQENLYLATQTYRQSGQIGYWPGPLDQTGNISKDECSAWNYHAKINKSVIEKFQTDFANNAFGTDERLLPQAIREWPARNNPHLVQSGRNMNYELAPFVNVGGQADVYEPLLGDYPQIQGDQGIWWVMNDAGNNKTPASKTIGLEYQVMAFAFQTNNLINNMTFYKQILKNKGANTLLQTYMGQWVDADLGFFNDDFVGCDVGRGLGICYNGDDNDEGPSGYGQNPPSVGVDFFKGPLADDNDGIDNDRDGVIDEAGERIIMSGFMYYNNDNNTTNGNPATNNATDFYNYLRGIWRDGKQVTYGKDGTDQTMPVYKFMFPGLSDPKGYGFSNPPSNPPVVPPFKNWTENNRDGQNIRNTPADRRFLQSAGPFTLNPGSVNELTIGVVWAQANSGGARGSLGLLLNADDLAQKLFDNDFELQQGPNAPELAVTELDQQLILTLKPVTFKTSNGDVVNTETYFEAEKSIANDPNGTDPFYRFEGYKVYQIKDPTVSASDLSNPDLARLVSQSDIKNGVTEIRNNEFDISLNQNIPKVKVIGNDQGLVHTINITTDQFATGNNRIVNYKSYHFLVVAYAYNPDPINNEQYLEGRFSTKAIGIPHKTEVENGGTVLTSTYGTASEIVRIFGTGNGGNVLEIMPQDEQDILTNNSKQYLTYQAGKAPFVVKVYDPKQVKGGDFRVKLSSRLVYRESSATGANVKIGDTIVGMGNYTQPNTYSCFP